MDIDVDRINQIFFVISSSHRFSCNGFEIVVNINIAEKGTNKAEIGTQTEKVTKVASNLPAEGCIKSSNKENYSRDPGISSIKVPLLITQEKVVSKKRTLSDLLKADDESLELLTPDNFVKKCGAKRIVTEKKK